MNLIADVINMCNLEAGQVQHACKYNTRALKCKPLAKNNEHLLATLDMHVYIHEIKAVDKH